MKADTLQLFVYRPSSARIEIVSGTVTQYSRPSPGILSYTPAAMALNSVDYSIQEIDSKRNTCSKLEVGHWSTI